jgi:hypothetical protein
MMMDKVLGPRGFGEKDPFKAGPYVESLHSYNDVVRGPYLA